MILSIPWSAAIFGSAQTPAVNPTQTRGEALRQAELAMMKRRGRGHPFYWASFIQSGDWTKLDGQR